MRTVRLFLVLTLAILSLALSLGEGDMEKCSIKQETACSGPLHSEDKSYTYSLGTQVDTEQLLKSQVSIYHQLRDRLHSEPEFPIFVSVKSDKKYPELINARLNEFLKKPEGKDLQFLKKINRDRILFVVDFLPENLRSLILKEVPLSRFAIPNEAYTEHVFYLLRKAFPKNANLDSLNDEQKVFLVKYGALAVLVSQGLARHVSLK